MNYKAILADMDGTINRGDTLIAGADDVYRELSGVGVRWLFLSNNGSTLAANLATKITRLGLPVSEDQVINSASALIREVAKNFVHSRIMVVGQPRLIQGIEGVGVTVTDDPSDTDIVVVALDRYFTYEKLKRAHRAIQMGALFWATNLDATYPEADGFSPGAGSVVASIATAAGQKAGSCFWKALHGYGGIGVGKTGG